MNILELNQRDREVLATILAKPSEELVAHEISIIKARVAYLDEDQLEKFAEHFKTKEVKKALETKKKPEVKKAPEVVEDAELIKLRSDADGLGIKTEGMTKEEIVTAIDTELAKN